MRACRPTAASLLLILVLLAPIDALDDMLIALFAVVGGSRQIFLRRYLIGPLLRLGVAATLMLGSSVREELREDGVGVTVSLPGWIDTEMAAGLPGEKATPREVAERSIDGQLAGEPVVWPDRFAMLVREQVEHRMLDLLTQPRAVMNEVAAQFTGVKA